MKKKNPKARAETETALGAEIRKMVKEAGLDESAWKKILHREAERVSKDYSLPIPQTREEILATVADILRRQKMI